MRGYHGLMHGSRIRSGNLRKVFNSDLRRAFDAHLAQLSVLYEDLRIELFSMNGSRDAALDAVESLDEEESGVGKYRRHYYLRRSFATIREFAECIKHLKKTPEFIAIRNSTIEENRKVLDDAVFFFSKNSGLLKTVRNNTGGHFGIKSALHAVEALDASAVGRIELQVDEHRANVKLHYAGELVATAFARGVDGKTNPEKIQNAIRTVAEAYKHATGIAQVMLADYLIDRFGK